MMRRLAFLMLLAVLAAERADAGGMIIGGTASGPVCVGIVITSASASDHIVITSASASNAPIISCHL